MQLLVHRRGIDEENAVLGRVTPVWAGMVQWCRAVLDTRMSGLPSTLVHLACVAVWRSVLR